MRLNVLCPLFRVLFKREGLFPHSLHHESYKWGDIILLIAANYDQAFDMYDHLTHLLCIADKHLIWLFIGDVCGPVLLLYATMHQSLVFYRVGCPEYPIDILLSHYWSTLVCFQSCDNEWFHISFDTFLRHQLVCACSICTTVITKCKKLITLIVLASICWLGPQYFLHGLGTVRMAGG